MAKTKKVVKPRQELDGIYLLKIVLYLIVGSQWVRLSNAAMTTQIPVPVGLVVGSFFAAHDHFRIDRKIEYALLLIACVIGFWFQVGLFITFK